jgi:RNA polymerase sigma-70 factor (ECF subfamily)
VSPPGFDFEELPQRLAALDEGAFREFAALFGPRLRALFVRRGLSTTDAEDLAMSCVTDISLKIDRYDPERGGHFAAWVFTLARHALADWWRKHRAIDMLPESLAAPEGELLMDSATVSGVVDAVREAVAQLPEPDRHLLRLRDLERNEPYSEIARQLGIRTETARVRHLRSLRKLRSLLESDSRIQPLLSRQQSYLGCSPK